MAWLLKTDHSIFVFCYLNNPLKPKHNTEAFFEFSVRKYYRSLMHLSVDRFTSSLVRYRLFWRHISHSFFKGLRMIFCSLTDVWSFSLIITSLPSEDVHRIRSEFLTETLMNFQVFRNVKRVWVVADVSTYCGAFIFKNYTIKFFLDTWSERHNVTSHNPWILIVK